MIRFGCGGVCLRAVLQLAEISMRLSLIARQNTKARQRQRASGGGQMCDESDEMRQSESQCKPWEGGEGGLFAAQAKKQP